MQSLVPFVVVRPRVLCGKQVVLATRDPSQITIFHEVFLDRVYDLSVVPFEPQHVLDCGAHVGLFTVLAYRHFPRASFTLFEPNPEHVRTLRKMLGANEFAATLFESAVSDHTGSTQFAPTQVMGRLLRDSEIAQGAFTVNCVDLAAYLGTNVTGNLLLKMDIEGHEMVVLPAILRHLPPSTAIFFETHSGHTGWNTLAELLKEAGFEVHQTRWHDPYADGYALRNG